MEKRNHCMHPVDVNKLKIEFAKRGLSLYKASLQMGYSAAGFTSATRDGTISERMLLGIKYRWGIEYDDIKPDEEMIENEVVQATEEKSGGFDVESIDWSRIEWHIRRAVAAALQDRGI